MVLADDNIQASLPNPVHQILRSYRRQNNEKYLKCISNLQIQEAWETLNDVDKRRKYDSTLTFDDRIPDKFDPATQDFFEEFPRIFKRNSRWSKKQPTPDLGDCNAPLKKVEKFYRFWERFDSWRDFTHDEEYDVNEAENRYEKRWMEKENKRLKKEMFKNERIRINRLVNFAIDFDPRMIAERERIENEKEARKQEVLKWKREKREKKEREEREAIERVENKKKQEAQAKIDKERAAILAKEGQKQIRVRFKEVFLANIKDQKMDSFYADEVVRKLRPDELSKILSLFEEKKISNPEEFKTYLKGIFEDRKSAIKLKKKQKQKEEKAKKLSKQREWTEDESRMLVKGVLKYPAGTHHRWTRITQFVGGRFSESEVADYARRLKNVKTQIKNKNHVHIYKVNQKKSISKKIKVNGGKAKQKGVKNGTGGGSSGGDLENGEGEDMWSQKQQKQLEKALKTHPGSLPVKERWQKIADDVEGKDMKECVQRFKGIRKKIKSRKAKK